jgi:hypothetical protein
VAELDQQLALIRRSNCVIRRVLDKARQRDEQLRMLVDEHVAIWSAAPGPALAEGRLIEIADLLGTPRDWNTVFDEAQALVDRRHAQRMMQVEHEQAAATRHAEELQLEESHGEMTPDFESQKEEMRNAILAGDAVTVADLATKCPKLINETHWEERLWTALILAVRKKNPDMIRLLVDAGADLEGEDKFGWRPLHHAAFYGFAGVCQELINLGANVDAQDDKKWTAVHRAAKSVQVDAFLVLMDGGADPSIPNERNRSAAQTVNGTIDPSGRMLARLKRWEKAQTARWRAQRQ